MSFHTRGLWIASLALFASSIAAAGNRLLATNGVTQVEGSAGGGLTPWAFIAGLGTNRQVGASASCTQIEPQDFKLRSCALALGWHDRVELSIARQQFDLGDVVPGESIKQTVVGVKVRVLGDAVFDQDQWLPQVAVGLQYKKNSDFDFVPKLIGARDDEGVDLYVTATKVYLAGLFDRTWLLNGTLRGTKANQFGILGFGGDRGNAYKLEGEASAALFLTDWLVAGAEYRQKPNLLGAFKEDDAWDGFVAWFPSKHASLTAAYVDLGNIAVHDNQNAWYLSLQASF